VKSSFGPVRVALLMFAVMLAAGALLVRAEGDRPSPADSVVPAAPPARATSSEIVDPYGTALSPVRIAPQFKRAPRAGLLFNLRTGRVMWRRNPARRLPIASLAKVMTAILAVDRSTPGEHVLITPEARATDGSKVGLLPPGRRVRLELLLYGLMLPSGNDAAVALAQHVSGSVPRFVAEMNAEARRMGLTCTHFSSPDGLRDRGNTACARDLAVLAREVLARRRLARIVRTEQVALPSLLPHTIKRGKRKLTVWRPGRLWLNSHNPLLRAGYRGTTGIKTGYTDPAGRCLVATVRRGQTTLGLVLLHSPDPGGQAMRIFNRAFRVIRLQATATARAST
jgi:serine-type D-Ala-D-Ala carboxypeptidase (penicillin-binding protein 5/6)